MTHQSVLRVLCVLAVLAPVATSIHEASAATGCCLQRQGVDWVRVGDDFELCDRLNRDDQDDIFEPSGQFWWSIDC